MEEEEGVVGIGAEEEVDAEDVDAEEVDAEEGDAEEVDAEEVDAGGEGGDGGGMVVDEGETSVRSIWVGNTQSD